LKGNILINGGFFLFVWQSQVIPAQAGIQAIWLIPLDSRLRGNDVKELAEDEW